MQNKKLNSIVTIGLCVKNSEKTIRMCIKSILYQDYPKDKIEVIVVDGGSKDDTQAIIHDMFTCSSLAVKFFFDQGKGLAFARQLVLDNAVGVYIVWVDGDVLLSENFVSNQVNFIQNKIEVAVVLGKFEYAKRMQKTFTAQLQCLSKFIGGVDWVKSKKRNGFPPNDASIYLVEAARQVGGFDLSIEGASEDEDIIERIQENQWKIDINEQAEFSACCRETWNQLWIEHVWFGYGNHLLSHKRKGKNFFLRYNPIIYIYVGIKHCLLSYPLTHEKKSILFPLLYLFNTCSLYFGFLKAHFEGYGHQKRDLLD